MSDCVILYDFAIVLIAGSLIFCVKQSSSIDDKSKMTYIGFIGFLTFMVLVGMTMSGQNPSAQAIAVDQIQVRASADNTEYIPQKSDAFRAQPFTKKKVSLTDMGYGDGGSLAASTDPEYHENYIKTTPNSIYYKRSNRRITWENDPDLDTNKYFETYPYSM